MGENKDPAGTGKHPEEISCTLEMAILLFYSSLQSLGTEDKLKFIVFSRLISHLVVTCEDLFDAV